VDSARAEAWKLEDEVKVKLRKDQNNFSLMILHRWVYSLVGNFFWDLICLDARFLLRNHLGHVRKSMIQELSLFAS